MPCVRFESGWLPYIQKKHASCVCVSRSTVNTGFLTQGLKVNLIHPQVRLSPAGLVGTCITKVNSIELVIYFLTKEDFFLLHDYYYPLSDNDIFAYARKNLLVVQLPLYKMQFLLTFFSRTCKEPIQRFENNRHLFIDS